MMLKEGMNNNRIPAGCAISGIFNKKGLRISGEKIIKSIALMHERSNGLGGGFAGYGIYPEYANFYAFHIFYDTLKSKNECEEMMRNLFMVEKQETIPTKKHPNILNEPLIWRYFALPKAQELNKMQVDELEFVARFVMDVNTNINGAYIFSSGKNMGVFKAVGYPEDVGAFYMLENYQAYLWTAHGRYPTNTPGWWGGAHPFALLNYSVVHNGEISSYDANRRYIEMFGYKCNLLTDTEVITYIIDYLLRVQKLSLEEVSKVIAAPFWTEIKDNEKLTYLRNIFSSLLITGPFSIILGFENGFMALNDRLKLRSMVVAENEDFVYVASEESAIRIIEDKIDKIYTPKGGEAVIYTLTKEGK